MSQNPARHLDTAAESIRAFNHTSRSTGQEWEYPSHSYDALGNLSHLAGMLEQAIGQTTGPVLYAQGQGRLRIDGDGDADAKVAELMKAREEALTAAAALTGALARMHNATSPMAFDTTGLPEFDEE